MNDSDSFETYPPTRKRKAGGGRKRCIEKSEKLASHIAELIPSKTGAFQWTTDSLRTMESTLRNLGHEASRNIVANELHRLGYRLNKNRKIPAGRRPSDVDQQFHLVDSAVSGHLRAAAPILIITGKREALNGRASSEANSKFIPPEIASIDEFTGTIVLPNGERTLYPRFLTDEEISEIRKLKTDSTVLQLENLVTERDGGIFFSEIIKHWFTKTNIQATRLLVLTHGASPDRESPYTWRWALDRLAKRIGIRISVCRIPPAIWRCTLDEQRLFHFTWTDGAQNGYSTCGYVLGSTETVIEEIRAIPPIPKSVPMTRTASRRVEQSFSIQYHDQFEDWNYCFTGSTEASNG